MRNLGSLIEQRWAQNPCVVVIDEELGDDLEKKVIRNFEG